MTASPKAVHSPTAKSMDGNKALAVLFAAATASAGQTAQEQQQQLKHNVMTTPTTRANSKPGHPQRSSHLQAEQIAQTMSANKLISSLLNRSAQSTSLPSSAKTTANLATTPSKISRTTLDNAKPTSVAGPSQTSKTTERIANNDFKLRNLESWFDEDAEHIDESQYQELADFGDTNGWSADEMFKYNEKMHNIVSNFDHKTISQRYSTPLSKDKSKIKAKLAAKLAAEIQSRVINEGRVTPESSDDDEQFEKERIRRGHLKKLKQLDQIMNLGSLNKGMVHSQTRPLPSSAKTGHQSRIGIQHMNKVTKPEQQLSDSSLTPATTSSTSSSPRPIDSKIASCSRSCTKSVTSSSRNILRANLN